MPLRDGFFSTATQTSCCNRIQRSNRVRLLVVSTHDFPDMFERLNGPKVVGDLTNLPRNAGPSGLVESIAVLRRRARTFRGVLQLAFECAFVGNT